MQRLLIIFALSLVNFGFSQNPHLISGPMLGYVEHRSALIWLEVDKTVQDVEIHYWEKDSSQSTKTVKYIDILQQEFNPVRVILTDLKMNTQYEYSIYLEHSKTTTTFPLTFKTRELWEYRKDPPEFSFVLGSCLYINDSLYDRPGKKYGKSPKILETMADQKADFNLWMGDNLYFREADYSSAYGMNYRYSHDRAIPELQRLLASRANFAIWDDHDFGPNDSDLSFELKDEAFSLFKKYWGNTSYGERGNEGVYTKFSYGDAEFFLTDDRMFRSSDRLPDSLNGGPNPDKTFFGKTQLKWIENALMTSRQPFKFVVLGGQVLNPLSKDECLRHYPVEYNELINFIVTNRISGVIFLTGDRHFSETIGFQPPGFYKILDFTCSPLTSSPYVLNESNPEFLNPLRVPGTLVMKNNFGKITISGPKDNRVVRFQTIDAAGDTQSDFSIKQSEIKP